MTAIAFWRARQYAGAGDWLDESGLGHDAAFNGTVFRPYDGEKYLALDGRDNNFAYVGDTAVLDITGDIDLQADAFLDVWVATAYRPVVSKALYAGNHRTYALAVKGNTTGDFEAPWSTDGINWTVNDSTTNPGFTNLTRHWIRKTLDVNNGAGGYDEKFWYGDNGIDWTQLGTTVVGGAPTSIYSSSAQLEIGRRDGGGGTYYNWDGGIYRVRIYNGIGGTLVFDGVFDDAVEPYLTFVDAENGLTITINREATGRPALVVDRDTMWLGSDQTAYFEVDDHAELDFAADEDFSIAGMVRVYDETPAAAMCLAGKKDDLTTAAGYMPYLDTDGKIKMVIDDTVETPVTVETAAISPGYATMWAFSRDADGNLQGYLDGVASGSPVADTTSATLANARPFRIGASSHATPASFLDGEVFGVALFREVLSPAAMWALNEEFRDTKLSLLRRARYRAMMRGG